MLWTPEAQATAHYWASTFGGHLAIGVPAWLLVMRPDPWWGVVIVGAVYALCWEVPSLLAFGMAPALAWDSALGSVGVTLGGADSGLPVARVTRARRRRRWGWV